MTTGKHQSFEDFTNQKQLRLTADKDYPVQHLSGDASTDNRQYQTENLANTAALEAVQASSGMFMHPMHDVTQTDQANGDQVLAALQQQLDDIEEKMDNSTGQIDPNEEQDRKPGSAQDPTV